MYIILKEFKYRLTECISLQIEIYSRDVADK